MKIDSVSRKIVTIALYLEEKSPNSISEIWIDQDIVSDIKRSLPSSDTIGKFINYTEEEIKEIADNNRKQYLNEILNALRYQITNANQSLSQFYKNCYGFEILRVSQDELHSLENNIKDIERKLKTGRFDVFRSIEVEPDKILPLFIEYLDKTKVKVPTYLTDIQGSEFKYELVTSRPWTAFNTHFAPYKSKLSLNQSIPITLHDLHHLSQHEAWGGHHSELSLKDRLLINEGKGEHGLVIVYSPQVFISEGIAEAMFDVFGLNEDMTEQERLIWQYNRYLFALDNYFAYKYFEDNISKEQIQLELENYDIGKVGRKAVLNFVTDPVFGKYSAVYYSARDYILNIYKQTNDKELFIKHLFTQPCTPTTLKSLFSK